jgi:hypothetical protein
LAWGQPCLCWSTFNCVTKSAVSRSVSREISSTIWLTRTFPAAPGTAAVDCSRRCNWHRCSVYLQISIIVLR